MNLLDFSIVEIHNVTEGKHAVLADVTTDCYGGKEQHTVCFHANSWPRIKSTLRYNESEGLSQSSFQYLEGMSDEDYHKRFERSLREFTDEELVGELNRRMRQFNSKIVINSVIAMKG